MQLSPFAAKKLVAGAVLLGVIMVVALIGGTLRNRGGEAPAPEAPAVPQAPGGAVPETPTQGGAKPSAQPTPRPGGTSQPAPGGAITVVTPAPGEMLVIGKPHIIRWSREGGSLGVITLVDTASKNIVGWISATLTFSQVTYSWDTRTVAISATAAARKEIAPGTYIVRLTFGGSKQIIDSAPYSIIATGEEKLLTREVLIRNSLFVPNTVSARSGERVALINNEEGITHTLLLNGIALVILPPRSAYVFDAKAHPSGSYTFGLGARALAHLTVTVQ